MFKLLCRKSFPYFSLKCYFKGIVDCMLSYAAWRFEIIIASRKLRFNFRTACLICFWRVHFFFFCRDHLWYEGILSLCGCMRHSEELKIGLLFIITTDSGSRFSSIQACLSIRLSTLFSCVQLPDRSFGDILKKVCARKLVGSDHFFDHCPYKTLFWKIVIRIIVRLCRIE